MNSLCLFRNFYHCLSSCYYHVRVISRPLVLRLSENIKNIKIILGYTITGIPHYCSVAFYLVYTTREGWTKKGLFPKMRQWGFANKEH